MFLTFYVLRTISKDFFFFFSHFGILPGSGWKIVLGCSSTTGFLPHYSFLKGKFNYIKPKDI